MLNSQIIKSALLIKIANSSPRIWNNIGPSIFNFVTYFKKEKSILKSVRIILTAQILID